MGTPVIEIEGLRKTYRRRRGRTVAVDNLSLAVPEGGVYGFLGPNGSGKTTTIRCLLGLVRPGGGEVRLLGGRVPTALPAVLPRVGAIVEAPALFPTMTGRQNLKLLAGLDRIGARRVSEALEEVGLADRADDLVRRYSLGMRQRLALAAALMKDPALLVLDEPANGLDPAGIRQVRELLRRLGREGRTVFLSSHILSEIEQTCDAVAIIHRGRRVAEGSVAAVLSSAGRTGMVVRATDVDAGHAALVRAGLPVELRDGHLRVGLPPESAARITHVLAAERVWITELRPEEHTLEDIFLELTADETTPGASADTGPVLEEVR